MELNNRLMKNAHHIYTESDFKTMKSNTNAVTCMCINVKISPRPYSLKFQYLSPNLCWAATLSNFALLQTGCFKNFLVDPFIGCLLTT